MKSSSDASPRSTETWRDTMSEAVEMMKCDWCGKEFPADPRACVEAGIDANHEPEAGEEWKGPEPINLDPAQFSPAQRQEIKNKMGISDTQLDELLSTGTVAGLGAIVCLECQDQDEDE
jgi:hypothetical protein